MPGPTLGVMQLVHARPHYLWNIWGNISRIGVPTHLQVVLSTPTDAVRHAVHLLERDTPRNLTVEVLDAPFRPLGDGRERFMEMRQWQLEHLPPTEYGVIWDDDHLLQDPGELRALLAAGHDLCYATKAFFWDDTRHVNTRFPAHRSVFTFRRLPGDRFPLDRTIHAPAKIHDCAASVVELTTPLLDFGYMRAEDRERCWRDYKRAGKIDAATLPLVLPPTLVELPDDPDELTP